MFVITVQQSDKTYRHVVADRGQNIAAVEITLPFKYEDFNVENTSVLKANNFCVMTDDEVHASQVARHIALHNHGCDVYLAKPVKVYGSGVPPIVEKKISVRGVLPA